MPRLAVILSLLVLSAVPGGLYSMNIFIGTYTSDGRSAGIHAVDLDMKTGRFGPVGVAAKAPNPTFLCFTPDHRFLCATSEVQASDGTTLAGVRAFQVGPGAVLSECSAQPVAAQGTSTHLVATPDGQTVLVVHYNAAWVASLGLDAAGRLSHASSFFSHEGKVGPNEKRQDKPHAHSITLSADGCYAYVCDLGLDLIRVYRVDSATHSLKAVSDCVCEPGSGPRHSKLSADGSFLYVVNELSGGLSVFARNSGDGSLKHVQTVSLLPEGFTGENTSAEVQVHPNGRFIYATSRGPDIITVLERRDDGRVAVVQRLSSGGRHPRHFALSPDGVWLVCANRDTDSLCSFAINPGDGRLTATGFSAIVPQPVCVLFAP